jgi:1,2-diacylglycerol 3-beta-galactosyltransferase
MPQSKRFLVLTADAGFGHRSAANAVAEALRDRYGEASQCVIANPVLEGPSAHILSRAEREYDRTVSQRGMYGLTYHLGDVPATMAIFAEMLKPMLGPALRQALDETRPDAVLSTYLFFQPVLRSLVGKGPAAIPLFVVATDLADLQKLWFKGNPDRLFLGSDKARQEALEAGLSPERLVVSGIPVDPRFALETRSKEALRRFLGWEADKTTLIAVGSRRVKGLYENLLAVDLGQADVQLVMVAGGDDDLYQEFLQTRWRLPAHVYNYVENLPEMLRAADVLVSKAGGLILSEALACGLPVLLSDVIPGQEEGNAQILCDEKAGVWARSPQEMRLVLESWLAEDGKVLKEFAANARRLGKPRAALDIAEALWQAAVPGKGLRVAGQGAGLGLRKGPARGGIGGS